MLGFTPPSSCANKSVPLNLSAPISLRNGRVTTLLLPVLGLSFAINNLGRFKKKKKVYIFFLKKEKLNDFSVSRHIVKNSKTMFS